MIRLADISADGTYRYRLQRIWDHRAPRMAFVMLNPSTADAEIDDPTIRRCINFARREDCGSLDVVNLYAYRATKPADLIDAAGAGVSPMGQANATFIAEVFADASVIVAAWGSTFACPSGWRLPRLHVESIARAHGRTMECLGRTKTGHPRHPLYVRGDQAFERWAS